MIRAVRSAWVALRRPAVLVSTLVASAAFAVLTTALTFFGAVDDPSEASTVGPEQATTAALAKASGVVAGLGDGTTFLGIVAMVVGASAVAADFQHGTLRTLLVRQPDRLRLLGGKVLAVAGLLVLAGVVAAVASVATALAVAPGAGVETGAWTLGEALAGAGRAAVAMAGFGVLGCGLGLWLRSSVGAIGVGLGWVVAVEQVVGGAWDGADDVLPGRLLALLADGTAGAGQLAALGAWLVVAVVLGAHLARTRDVTA